ncbi:MAG TPA: serine hydrolase [Dongiaceae bacterium]|nr:serine hydrolase [Dongiaceae bacterium]
MRWRDHLDRQRRRQSAAGGDRRPGGLDGVHALARRSDHAVGPHRTDPTLNESTPGDERDTTKPAAITADLKALILGDALSSGSKKHLTDWMIATKTGDARLRAGLPKD